MYTGRNLSLHQTWSEFRTCHFWVGLRLNLLVFFFLPICNRSCLLTLCISTTLCCCFATYIYLKQLKRNSIQWVLLFACAHIGTRSIKFSSVTSFQVWMLYSPCIYILHNPVCLQSTYYIVRKVYSTYSKSYLACMHMQWNPVNRNRLVHGKIFRLSGYFVYPDCRNFSRNHHFIQSYMVFCLWRLSFKLVTATKQPSSAKFCNFV